MENRPTVPTPSDLKKSFKISDLLWPHRRTLALGAIAALGESAANLLEPWPLKIVFDNVLKSRTIGGWLSPLIVSFTGGDKLATLRFAALAVLAIAAVGAICSYAEKYSTTSVSQWVMHDLRQRLYFHIQRLSLAYHDHKQTGDLISRVTTDIDAIQSFIASGLLDSMINLLTLVGMMAVMFYMNWRFTLIALSVAPLLSIVIYRYTRSIKRASREVRKKEGEIVSVIQEVLSSIRVVKAFAREDYELRRLQEESLESVDIALRARTLKAKLAPLVEMIVAAGTCLVLWFGARMTLTGALSAGSLIVFIMYLGKMYKPMQALSKMTDAYSKALVGYERIREVLETHMEIRDLPGARKIRQVRGGVEFERVHFGYEPNRLVLKDVNFRIEPGQTAAFVGPTGAGKTSIISLIPRFYDPVSGQVKIDGFNVKGLQQESLRQQISFVLQETILFHAPIWRNIAYGRPDASRAEILQAAQLANAHEFIQEMPEGYDTSVGERGVTLSGGQRQRIAIARAIVRNSPILILDEPTTGLDAASEKLVMEALDRLMEGHTSVVIAHDLSTIRRADIIFVVREGQIVESGTHERLLETGLLYSQLWMLQAHAEESVQTGAHS